MSQRVETTMARTQKKPEVTMTRARLLADIENLTKNCRDMRVELNKMVKENTDLRNQDRFSKQQIQNLEQDRNRSSTDEQLAREKIERLEHTVMTLSEQVSSLLGQNAYLRTTVGGLEYRIQNEIRSRRDDEEQKSIGNVVAAYSTDGYHSPSAVFSPLMPGWAPSVEQSVGRIHRKPRKASR